MIDFNKNKNIIKFDDYLNKDDSLPKFKNNCHKKNSFKIKKSIKSFFDLSKSQFISIILLLVVFVIIILYFNFRKYNDINILWKYYYTNNYSNSSGNIKYLTINKSIIRYTNDGITLVDEDGYVKWSVAYNLKNPIIEKQNNYFTISSIGENLILIFNENGLITQIETQFPIQKIDISNTGTVFVMLDGGDSSFINVYDKTGKELDIIIKSLLSADGTPLDFSISDDGTQLIVSYGYIENEAFNTRIVIYNFDEVGKNVGSSRIVGGFDNEFKNKYIARVKFINNTTAICFYDGGLTLFSTKIQFSPKIIKNIIINNTIKSIAYNEKFVVVITDNNNDNANYELKAYDMNGTEVFNVSFNEYYDNLLTFSNYIAITYENKIKLYSIPKGLILDKSLTDSIFYINNKNKILFNEFYICTENYVECVSLIH